MQDIVPPKYVARLSLQKFRPMPLPKVEVEKSGAKIFGIVSAGMPEPLSEKDTRNSLAASVTVMLIEGSSVMPKWLNEFLSRLKKTWIKISFDPRIGLLPVVEYSTMDLSTLLL